MTKDDMTSLQLLRLSTKRCSAKFSVHQTVSVDRLVCRPCRRHTTHRHPSHLCTPLPRRPSSTRASATRTARSRRYSCSNGGYTLRTLVTQKTQSPLSLLVSHQHTLLHSPFPSNNVPHQAHGHVHVRHSTTSTRRSAPMVAMACIGLSNTDGSRQLYWMTRCCLLAPDRLHIHIKLIYSKINENNSILQQITNLWFVCTTLAGS